MNKRLLRILYTSKTYNRLSKADLSKLLQQCRDNNDHINIKGILCYTGNDFIQVIEGPEEATIRLYHKILNDDRHYDCKLINISLSSSYIFNSWSMGYLDISHGDMQLLRQELPEKLSNDNAEIFAYQLRNYLNTTPQQNTAETIFI